MSAETSHDGSLDGLAADLASSPYEPVRFLARGGMGEVVVVQHRELGRNLVMKLLRSNLEGQEHLAERMRAEARMLARLSHPNLVTVVDSGRTASGRPFLVTELLEGSTLAEYLAARGGVLPAREALELTAQALAGLQVVHEAGFVHRDLKPANLFLVATPGGASPHLKILDFGIAKALSDADRKALGLIAPTAEGAIMGTPSSVSPEQVQSGKIDARTDVYGLGVVLFRILAGRPPFTGDALALFRAHLLEPAPAPSSIAPQPVPAIVDRIVLRSLEKDPAKRYPSAADMRAAVEGALRALALDADPTEESEGEGNARTVDVSRAELASALGAPRDTSEDETTTRPVGSLSAGTAALPAVGAGGTAVIDLAATAGLAPAHATGSVTPSPSGPSVRVFAPKPDAPAAPSPSGTAQRKTELIARAASSAPRDTVKLEEARSQGEPWKYDPAVSRPRADRPAPPVAPPRSALATWGAVLLAVVASVIVLLFLFVWRVV